MAKFNFLQKIDNIENVAVYQILNKYGKEICEYAKDYFNYIVTYSSESENKKITSISLYILSLYSSLYFSSKLVSNF